MSTTYTKEQIEARPAGHELDILVATTLMGYRWMAYTRYPGEYVRLLVPGALAEEIRRENGFDNWTEGESPEARMIETRHVLPHFHAPMDFSTNIAAAWQVVEKMRGKKDDTRFWIVSQKNGGWEVGAEARNSLATATIEEASLPLAICKASLLLLC